MFKKKKCMDTSICFYVSFIVMYFDVYIAIMLMGSAMGRGMGARARAEAGNGRMDPVEGLKDGGME